MLKYLLQDQEIIYHLDFDWSIVKKKLVLYSYTAELGGKTAVERDALAVSGGEINSTRGRGNRLFPLVQPTQLKTPQTVSDLK